MNHLTRHLESQDVLPESQCGFRPGRSTVDMNFATCQLQEKCREQNVGLDSNFVHLTMAFDMVEDYVEVQLPQHLHHHGL